MGRACFAGSGVTGAGCKRVVMDYPRPRSSGRFESICVLLVSFFRGLRFGRCGCRVGGLKSLIRWLAGGWANNGEPTSRSPVPGRGHLFQQGSPPSPPWCVRPGAFFRPPALLPPFPYPVSAPCAAGHEKGDPFRGRPLRRSSVVALLLGLHSVKSGLDRGRCMWGGDRCADIRPGAGEGACLLEYS